MWSIDQTAQIANAMRIAPTVIQAATVGSWVRRNITKATRPEAGIVTIHAVTISPMTFQFAPLPEPTPAPTIDAAPEAAPKKRVNPVQFAKEVRAEARKITWTSRKETWITSVMVFIMVVLASLLVLGLDFLLTAWMFSI